MKTIINIEKKIKKSHIIKKKIPSGIVLLPWEIKSIKKNGFQINGSYGYIKNKEIFLMNSCIKNKDQDLEKRKRKLLLKKKEINEIEKEVKKKYIIIPIKIYWQKKFLKIELCLCLKIKKRDEKKIKLEIIKNKEMNQIV